MNKEAISRMAAGLSPYASPEIEMDVDTLVEVFDGVEGVVVHDSVGLISAWNGSATVNVYTLDGRCVDCWTDYDLDKHNFRAAAIEHIDSAGE